MTFRDRLRELRDGAEMTQEGLSDAAKVPLSSLRGYEQGKRLPGFGAIVRLANALGTDCRAFADCEDIDGEPPAPAKPTRKKGGGTDAGAAQ